MLIGGMSVGSTFWTYIPIMGSHTKWGNVTEPPGLDYMNMGIQENKCQMRKKSKEITITRTEENCLLRNDSTESEGTQS